jgi:hypothetical protein
LWEKKNSEFKKKGGRESNKCSRREVNGREERMDIERKGKVMGSNGEIEALYEMERKKGLKRGTDNGEKEKKATGMKNLREVSIGTDRNERQRKKRAGRI